MSNRIYLRHRWSHRGRLHRVSVRIANRVLGRVPFAVKYSLAGVAAGRELPYSLLQPGDTAVQVGAPHDTLRAGRSRAVHLALRVGPRGRVVVVEPDPASAAALRKAASEHRMPQLLVVESGAWSSQKELRLYVDPAHPATNFTEDTADYSPEEIARFEVETVPVDSVDNILERLDVSSVKLVSITTNGSEREIIAGMSKTLARGLPYIALARTDDWHEAMMTELGYGRLGFDNRGYTFSKNA